MSSNNGTNGTNGTANTDYKENLKALIEKEQDDSKVAVLLVDSAMSVFTADTFSYFRLAELCTVRFHALVNDGVISKDRARGIHDEISKVFDGIVNNLIDKFVEEALNGE